MTEDKNTETKDMARLPVCLRINVRNKFPPAVAIPTVS